MNDWELKPGNIYAVTAVEHSGEESTIESRNTALSYAMLRPVHINEKTKDEVLLVRFRGCHLQVGQRVMGVDRGWFKQHLLAGSVATTKLVIVGVPSES